MTHDEMIAVIQADKDGKRVQSRHANCDREEWQDMTAPSFNFGARDYRVAPEPVPPGDLTWEEANRLHESGVKVDFLRPGGTHREWFTVDAWFDNATEGEIKSAAYRRTPAPRMVELEWTEINLHRDLFRWLDHEASPGCCIAVSAGEGGLAIGAKSGLLSWSEVQHYLARSTDGGATWQRCEKPAKEEAP